MSTKTLRKRIALVAVSALGFGLLSAAPSSAAPSTGTTAIGPVRVSMTGSSQDAVNGAAVVITADSAWTSDDLTLDQTTITVTLTTAPSAAAELTLAHALYTAQGDATNDASVTLADDGALYSDGTDTATFAGTTTGLTINANVSGRYVGTIVVLGETGGDTLTAPFDFTTTGAPTSYTFTSDVASSAVSGTITSTVRLLDANLATTQGSTVDTFALTVAIAGTATVGTLAAASATAANLTDGVHANVYTNSVTAASTSTLTATPQGTLGGLGVKTLVVTTVAASSMATAAASVALSTTTVAAAGATVAATSTTAGMNAYTVAPSQSTVTFNVTGLTASTSVTYSVTSSTSTTVSVNGATAADISGGASTTAIASATGTLTVTALATTPAAQIITLDLNAGTADAAGQTDAQITYASPVYAATLTSPTATTLAVSGSTLTYTGTIADQFGNKLGGATVTATGATAVSGVAGTALTATTSTDAAGAFTMSLTPLAATTTVTTTVSAVKSGLTAAITDATAHVTNLTATGIAATLVLTDNDTAGGTALVDNIASRAVVVAPAAMSNGIIATTDNSVMITPQTTLPGSIAYSVTATNGIRVRLATTSNTVIFPAPSAAVTSTGGTAFYATPTRVGAGVITVVSGGLTQTFTLTGTAPATPKAQLVTLTAGTNANGKAAYTVTTTDTFGNVVAADVNITMSGAGYLSNGFKNMTLSTLATDGSNSFDVISDGSAASGITATIASGSYTAISATEATTQGVSASVQAATASVTVVPNSCC